MGMDMATRRFEFVGVPAVVGRIDGEWRCGFWSGKAESALFNYDKDLLIPFDATLCPGNYAKGEIPWEKVVVDDERDDDPVTQLNQGGVTDLGPFGTTNNVIGAVYFERNH